MVRSGIEIEMMHPLLLVRVKPVAPKLEVGNWRTKQHGKLRHGLVAGNTVHLSVVNMLAEGACVCRCRPKSALPVIFKSSGLRPRPPTSNLESRIHVKY